MLNARPKLLSVNMRKYNAETDSHLPWLDHTRITALLACPKWGMIRYMEGKTIEAKRSMALEAGGALHECFAFHRLHHLFHQQARPDVATRHAAVVYGADKAPQMIQLLEERNLNAAMLECLYATGYYNDPNDAKRTLENMEVSLLHYVANHDLSLNPIYFDDEFVGIEVPIQFVMEFTYRIAPGGPTSIVCYVYTGRADGVSYDAQGLIIEENKTSTSLAGDWSTQWHTSHQPTGYCVGIGLALGKPCNRANIIGLQIKLPRNVLDGYKPVPVERHPRQFNEWVQWVWSAALVYEANKDTPAEAPMNTHYCYRYFHPCPFWMMCSGDEETFNDFYSEMVVDQWNPLESD